MTVQLIEKDKTTENIICSTCHHVVLDWAQEQYLQPCDHTAFIALDLGFEYISDEFEQKMPVSVDEIHDQELNVFEHITQTDACLLIYKMPLGVAHYSRYVGFITK